MYRFCAQPDQSSSERVGVGTETGAIGPISGDSQLLESREIGGSWVCCDDALLLQPAGGWLSLPSERLISLSRGITSEMRCLGNRN